MQENDQNENKHEDVSERKRQKIIQFILSFVIIFIVLILFIDKSDLSVLTIIKAIVGACFCAIVSCMDIKLFKKK